MEYFVPPLEVLVEQFAKLPGIGRKSAQRLAFHVLNSSEADANKFAEAIINAKKLVKYCNVCQNITDSEVCSICNNPKRDSSVICVTESPKDVISIEKTKRKGEKLFAYTDGEKEQILAQLTEDGLSKGDYDIKRSKGLGENQPEMMSLTTMHPATRRLIRVTPENIERTAQMFDVLLGDNLASRKDYIANNGELYMEMLDLS